MAIHEITIHELNRILTPIFRLEPLGNVMSEIGEILGSDSTYASDLAKEFSGLNLHYREFQIHISDLRWIRDRGPSITIQFRCPAKGWHDFFPDSEWLAKKVTRELVDDLKKIAEKELDIPRFSITQIDGFSSTSRDKKSWWSIHQKGVFNRCWSAVYDVSTI